MFPCVVFIPRHPIRLSSYTLSNLSYSSFTPYYSGRTGIGAVKNVSKVDGERNLQIFVYDEGRLSTFFELLVLVVVGNSSG